VTVAVITGAASGFGRALAQQCAAQGMDVALLDYDGEGAGVAAKQIFEQYGGHYMAMRADVGSSAEVDAAAALVAEKFGRVDLLWSNVGVQHFGAVDTIDDAVWTWVLNVNVVGAARTARAFLPLLRAGDQSRIAFTASANALAPAARLGAYQASKYAIVGLAETLRFELAGDGISVSVVYPSGMITRHLESSAAVRPSTLGDGAVDPEDLMAMMASRPMTERDLVMPEVAAERALAGVLAGEPHVITHGDLATAVAVQQAAINAAVSKLEE
jgi:NAD(P)-dependent dehydrogenase (short-subunit alcohol dehydrogenase family)